MMRDFAFTALVILSLVAGCAGPNATQTSAPTRTPIPPTATLAIETQETTESPTLVDVTAENIAPPFHTLAEFEDRLETAVNSGDIDAFWDTIVATGQMPLIFGDTAVFMYRGEADTVKWSLDYAISDRMLLMNMQGIRQGDTDLWVFKRQFPTDARLSYRIILNGDPMILDPLNPCQAMEGSGPVSELRMPDYVPPETTIPRDDILHGTLGDDITVFSDSLGYHVNYRVYTPFGYEDMQNLPVIYVTDGQDYAHDDLGAMVIVLDNLIADGAIEPVIAVFIDPRDPETGKNRREREFIANEYYDTFLTTELVPAIDAAYRTSPSPDARAILGSSNGGFHSAYVGLKHSDVFHLIAMQSPSFARYWVIKSYKESDRLPLKVFMSVGTIGDVSMEVAHYVRDVLESKEYPLLYIEISDGHSWANYRSLLDDMLIYFFGRGDTS